MKKIYFLIISIIISVFLFTNSNNLIVIALDNTDVVQSEKTLYDEQDGKKLTIKSINHRGYNTAAPENTLPAYELSAQIGFHYVETDVSLTADGVPVLLHDDTINRTARNLDGTKITDTINISDITYEQALEYDFGIWKSQTYAGTKIPTFEQFIVMCRQLGLHPYIEIKSTASYTDEQIQHMIDIVHRNNMSGRVTYISNIKYLTAVKNYDKYARLGLIVNSVGVQSPGVAQRLLTGYNEVFIDANINQVAANTEQVQYCIEADMPLEVWESDGTVAVTDCHSYVSGYTMNKIIAGKEIENPLNFNIKYQSDIYNMVRAVYIADLDETKKAQTACVNIYVNSILLDSYKINYAYKSIYANGCKLTAPEGKCYIISPKINSVNNAEINVQYFLNDSDKGHKSYL